MRRTTPPMASVKQGHGGRRGKRGIGRYLLGGVIALVLALFSGVIWFAYQDLMPGGSEAPPVIRADATPLKQEPDERGGLPLLNEESPVVQSLDEPDSPVRVERIVPRESAAPRSTADVIPDVLEAEPRSDADLALAGPGVDQVADAGDGTREETGDSLDTLLAEIVDGQDALSVIEPGAGSLAAETAATTEVPQPADALALPEGDVAALQSPSAVAPARPAPVAAAPSATGTATTAATTPGTGTSALPAAPAVAATPAPSAPVAAAPATPAPVASAPVASAPVASAPVAAAPVAAAPAAAPAETTVAALPPPALAPSFAGAYGVQLLAVRDEAAAAGAWTGLQRQHPAVLGPLRSRVQRADIGGNTFYRLQAGPFADRAGANAVCTALQARGMDCFIVEPTS